MGKAIRQRTAGTHSVAYTADEDTARWRVSNRGKMVLFVQIDIETDTTDQCQLTLGVYPGDPPNPRNLCSAIFSLKRNRNGNNIIFLDNFTLLPILPDSIESLDSFENILVDIVASHWEDATLCR